MHPNTSIATLMTSCGIGTVIKPFAYTELDMHQLQYPRIR